MPAGVIYPDWIGRSDILYVGDSESLGFFGDELYRAISSTRDPVTSQNLTVGSIWICGSDAEDWTNGGVSSCGARACDSDKNCSRTDRHASSKPVRYPGLRAYLEKVQPRITLIALGANVLTRPLPDFSRFYPAYFKALSQLLGEISRAGSLCIWIGPPQLSPLTKPLTTYAKFNRDLRIAVRHGNCLYIDSNQLSDRSYIQPADKEGVHYQKEGELLWARRTWPQLRPDLMELLYDSHALARYRNNRIPTQVLSRAH